MADHGKIAEAKQVRGKSRTRTFVLLLPLGFCLPLCGCAGVWDDLTSRDFSISTFFAKPNPLLVLRDSNDGDLKAKALRALREPKQHGGTDQEQEAVLSILVKAATVEKQPLCRLAAVESLGRFKDPRAIEGLTTAFYNAGAFTPDTASVIRCQALNALGATQSPAAIELLVRVVNEPPAEGPDVDRQLTLDVRIAAARALGNFTQAQAVDALYRVMRNEKDVALRDCAHDSLVAATGKSLPVESKDWEPVVRQVSAQAPAAEPSKKKILGIF